MWVIKLRSMRWARHVAHRGEGHTGFWCGNLWKRDYLEDPGIDGRIMLKWVFRMWDGGGGGGMDWVDLAQNRYRWQALVNAVMNIQVPSYAGNSWTS
jgi:hypothetical protein